MLADFGFTNQLKSIEWKVQNEIDELYENEKSISEEEKKTTKDELRVEKTREVIELKIVDLVNQKERERANVTFQKAIIEKAGTNEEVAIPECADCKEKITNRKKKARAQAKEEAERHTISEPRSFNLKPPVSNFSAPRFQSIRNPRLNTTGALFNQSHLIKPKSFGTTTLPISAGQTRKSCLY